jgi:flagellin-like protein
MRSRKAVSPLIATVLLIAFAVALGAVVMNWSHSLIPNDGVTEESCPDIKLYLETDAEGNDKICQNGDVIEAVVRNDGSVNIVSFKYTIYAKGSNKVDNPPPIEQVVRGHESMAVGFNVPNNFGTVEKIVMVPLLDQDIEPDEFGRVPRKVCNDNKIEKFISVC